VFIEYFIELFLPRGFRGTPHLDNEYTVFGEVVEGLEVVGKIQSVETGTADRPKTDVVILSMQVIGN
jgi:peptidylprolyl isomerase